MKKSILFFILFLGLFFVSCSKQEAIEDLNQSKIPTVEPVDSPFTGENDAVTERGPDCNCRYDYELPNGGSFKACGNFCSVGSVPCYACGNGSESTFSASSGTIFFKTGSTYGFKNAASSGTITVKLRPHGTSTWTYYIFGQTYGLLNFYQSISGLCLNQVVFCE